MSENNIHIRIFSSGYCTGNNRHIHRGERSGKLKFPAIWALIKHPQLGFIVFDTGYTRRFNEATQKFPEAVYRWITPVSIETKEECIQKLQDIQIDPSEINHVLISHFHADHIGGLKDFHGSKIWCQQKALQLIKHTGRIKGISKGLLKSLVPEDLDQYVSFPERELPEENIDGLSGWKWSDHIWFIDLPGHARGHMGLLIKGSNLGDILFIGDATWSAHSFRDGVYPSRLVSLIADGYHKLTETINLIHQFHLANPDTIIVPSHCSETLKELQSL